MAILRLMARLLLIISVIIIGSRPVYNENFAIIEGDMVIEPSSNNHAEINYPNGFNMNNSVVVSCGIKASDNYGYNYVGDYVDAISLMFTAFNRYVNLRQNDIRILVENPTTEQTQSIHYKIILMKLPTGNEASQLGDVNLDGEVDQDDLQMIRDYITGQESLNFDQYSNADMNKDGQIKSIDYVILKNILGIE